MTDYLEFCCDEMRAKLNWACADHSSASECPDALVGRFGRARTYGLYIHDGGASFLEIHFCPWCGAKLPNAGTDDREAQSAPIQLDTVYADFNNRDGNALSLSCNGTKADLVRLGLVLRDGLELRVSDGDLVGVGKVRWVPGLRLSAVRRIFSSRRSSESARVWMSRCGK
jgi:hypothetical protein